MKTFFSELGQAVLTSWGKENFSLKAFPNIATKILQECNPSKNIELKALQKDFLLNNNQLQQTNSGFGQPELIVFHHPRFYIQVLFWLDGTTDIHQHAFSGAFHVLSGSSIHTEFEFTETESLSSHFKIGELKKRKLELLTQGKSVPIRAKDKLIHSLFHLDTPSVTVVIRTHNDALETQLNYLPPCVALDPTHSDPLNLRRLQLLDVLHASDDDEYADLVIQMINSLDLETAFSVLQHTISPLTELGEWKNVFSHFAKKHGQMATELEASILEESRRTKISQMRTHIIDSDHRFFLALIMNSSIQSEILDLVSQRVKEEDSIETVIAWLCELIEVDDFSTSILNASFPEILDLPQELQAEQMINVARQSLLGNKPEPGSDEELILQALIGSSLKPLF
ncbi:hypothetical protein GW915_12635 [bacterium]|nr:hypothetical protein [bacterium]